MDRDIHELIHGYFDASISDEDAMRLSEWIKQSPENAQSFARVAMLHDRLQCEMVATGHADSNGPQPTGGHQTDNHAATLPWQRPLWLAGLAASLLLVALGVWSQSEQAGSRGQVVTNSSSEDSLASIAQLVDARWPEERDWDIGTRIGAERITIQSGVVRLQFDDGVEVTLEGPADYEVIALGKTRLHAGLLSATVPPGAEGFHVDTPSVRVTDLGTAFGIQLDSSGAAEVSVFDGEVDISSHDSDEQRLLKEGEAVRISVGDSIEITDFDTRPFEKLWPISSGITSSSGAFRFAPPWPRRLHRVRSDSEVFVIPEDYAVTLADPLRVNVSTPGEYIREEDLTPSVIPAGKSVRSFILHYHPEQAKPPRFAERITGSIAFDRPVLGLILLHEELKASAGRFSQRRAGEAHERRQIELRDSPVGDQVTLSPDRRTVTLNLASPNLTSDLVRVIVDASVPTAGEGE